jgi:hypothetical protein
MKQVREVLERHQAKSSGLWLRIGFAALLAALAVSNIVLVSANPASSMRVALQPRDLLLISSTRSAIQSVYIHGNLSQIAFDSPKAYPTSEISLIAKGQANIDLTILFENSEDYGIAVAVKTDSGNVRDIDNFYLSNGSFTLDIAVTVVASQLKTSEVHVPPARDFSKWFVQFGQAFPLWTKLLYAVLGIQFFFVGYEKIAFDSQRRRDRKLRPLDSGNKIYLAIDVICKFLLTCLALTAALMVGQAALLVILRLMFVNSINMSSIWNLFVLIFLAVITVSAYLLRAVLHHKFDLDPPEVD